MKVVFRVLALVTVLVYLMATGSGILLRLTESVDYSLAVYSLHFRLALLAAVGTLFLHSIVMIYFIVTHKAVKEGFKNRDLAGEAYHRRMRALKMDTLPWTTTGMLIMIVATIMGAATDTGRLPAWTHTPAVLAAMGLNVYLFVFAYRKLRENIDLLHEANEDLLEHDEAEEAAEKQQKEMKK